MAEHTPGPWRVDGEGTLAFVLGADLTIVAVRHSLPRAVHEANARLIAAAPELLAALEILMAEVTAAGLAAATDFNWPNAVAGARAAIAKARGQS